MGESRLCYGDHSPRNGREGVRHDVEIVLDEVCSDYSESSLETRFTGVKKHKSANWWLHSPVKFSVLFLFH